MITKAQALAEYLGHPDDDDVNLVSLTNEIGHYEADGNIWLVSEENSADGEIWKFIAKRYNYWIYQERDNIEIQEEDDDV